MAVHVPLTQARVGSLSTKTAYPPIVDDMASVASAILGSAITIGNRLVAMTKPEVVSSGVTLGLAQALPHTASCWSWHRKRKHCGVCVPCMTRRICFEIHGVTEARPHLLDPFSDPSVMDKPFAKDNLVHLCTVLDGISTLDDFDFEIEHPEILGGGTHIDPRDARDVYRRWVAEALGVLRGYPVPAGLLDS